MRRVYHPTLNSWRDIKPADADRWKAAGWRLTKPDHVDDSESLPVQADAPALAAEPAKSEKKSAKG